MATETKKKKCAALDLECLPPLPCEGEDGHPGPHFRTHAKDIPNHPNPGGAVYFTGVDDLDKVGEKLRKVVKLASRAEAIKIQSSKAEAAKAELEAINKELNEELSK